MLRTDGREEARESERLASAFEHACIYHVQVFMGAAVTAAGEKHAPGKKDVCKCGFVSEMRCAMTRGTACTHSVQHVIC